MDEKSLVPIEQKEVLLYEDNITAVRAEDGHVYVVMAHMCDALGIDTQAQARRIRRHTVLANGLAWVAILTTQGGQTQHRRTQVLRVDLVPLWLSGLRASMVNEEIRPKLEKFQAAAAAVLWEAFQDGRLTADLTFDDLLHQASTDAVEAYQLALAVVKLARNQVLLEAQIGQHGRVLDDYGRRLESIEATLRDPERYVTREQAARISQAVKVVGHALTQRNGRSEYAAVYGDLYRNFDISSYKELPSAQYEQAMAWLNAWYQRLTNSDIPF